MGFVRMIIFPIAAILLRILGSAIGNKNASGDSIGKKHQKSLQQIDAGSGHILNV